MSEMSSSLLGPVSGKVRWQPQVRGNSLRQWTCPHWQLPSGFSVYFDSTSLQKAVYDIVTRLKAVRFKFVKRLMSLLLSLLRVCWTHLALLNTKWESRDVKSTSYNNPSSDDQGTSLKSNMPEKEDPSEPDTIINSGDLGFNLSPSLGFAVVGECMAWIERLSDVGHNIFAAVIAAVERGTN